MAHRETYEFKYSAGTPPPPDANDLHIELARASGGSPLEVLGIDGKDPDDADSGYTVTDGGSRIDIKGVDVSPGEKLKVRIKSEGQSRPRFTAWWTKDGSRIRNSSANYAAAFQFEDEIGNTALASAIVELSDRLLTIESKSIKDDC